MKKSILSVPFEEEKLQALRLFAGKKDASIESELDDALQKLYEKYVPKDARELVELMTSKAEPPRPKAAKKDPVAKPTAKMEVDRGMQGSDTALNRADASAAGGSTGD